MGESCWLFDDVTIPFPEIVQMTPDLKVITDFYPEYVKETRASGREPVPFPGYLWSICKEAERRADFDRDADTWQRRWIEHFGVSELVRLQNV